MKLSSGETSTTLGVYIDGFNLYHACVAIGDPRLKWLNFRSLAASYLKPNELLGEVYFFTTIPTWDAEKAKRHRNFIAAQEALGVRIKVNFKKVKKWCDERERYCK